MNGYQLCSAIKAVIGSPVEIQDCHIKRPVDYLVEMSDAGFLRLPFRSTNVLWIETRLSVLTEFLKKPKKSLLVQNLLLHSGEILLIVDALSRGKDALYFAWLEDTMCDVARCIEFSNSETLQFYSKSIEDGQILVLATLSSFVRPVPW